MTRAHIIALGILGLILAELCASAPATPQPAATAHYVTATATGTGDGTAGAPWTLATALAHPAAVQPGDTIWVRGGLYERRYPAMWSFEPGLRGTAEAPIIVRAMPGERVQVTGAWRIFGSDTWYWGIEHTYLGTESRVSAESGSGPTDQPVRGWVSIYGDRVKLINPIIHDLNEGIAFFGGGSLDSSVYGAIIFNNGWQGTDRGNGNGMYIQSAAGTKWITDCISFNSFSTAMKGFGTAAAVKGLIFDGVMNFNAGAYAVGTPSQGGPSQNLLVTTNSVPAEAIAVKNSAFYHPPAHHSANVSFGNGNALGVSTTVTDNYAAGGSGISIDRYNQATVTGNTVYARETEAKGVVLARATGLGAGAVWDRNTYFDGTLPWAGDGRRYSFIADGGQPGNEGNRAWTLGRIPGWLETTGYDQNSTYTVGRPTGTKVIVRPNRYEVGRAHIAVYNWGGAATVPADVSSVGLNSGDRYEVLDVQNLIGPPVASGTYTGAPISLPMNPTTVARATGMTWEPRHTAPEFAVFVLRKVAGPSPPTGSSFLLRIFTDPMGRFLRAEPVPEAPTVPM